MSYPHNYSDALRAVAPHLAAHPLGVDMLRAVARLERYSDCSDGFAVASAVYWMAVAWHGGQGCPLYAALSALSDMRYSPGLASGPDCEVGQIMLSELERILKGDA